jgi:hypothetical protein
MKLKFPAAVAVAAAFAAGSLALASAGVTVKTTPTRANPGQKISMLVRGMKPGEKIKATEHAPYGQTQTSYPRFRVNRQGVILVTTTARVKGKHRWVFTGRRSHRTGSTSYYVK